MFVDLLIKAVMALGFKLLTSEALQDLIVFILNKAAKSTKTDFDDELVAIINKHLDGKK